MSDSDFGGDIGGDSGGGGDTAFDSGTSAFNDFGGGNLFGGGAASFGSQFATETAPGTYGGNTMAVQETMQNNTANTQQGSTDTTQANNYASTLAANNTGGNGALSGPAASSFANYISGSPTPAPSSAPINTAPPVGSAAPAGSTTAPGLNSATPPNVLPGTMNSPSGVGQIAARPMPEGGVSAMGAMAPNMTGTVPGTPQPGPDNIYEAPNAPQVAPTPAQPLTGKTISDALSQHGVNLPWFAPNSVPQQMADFINQNPNMSGTQLVQAAQQKGLGMTDDQAGALAQHLDSVRAPTPAPAAQQASGPFPGVPQGTAQASGLPAAPAPAAAPKASPQVQQAVAQEQPATPPSDGQYPGRYGLPSGMQLNSPQAWDAYANRTVQMESNFQAGAQTGSYGGYGQYSASEAAARGIDRGNLGQVKQALIQDGQQRAQILQSKGLPVTPGNVYLMHQQGVAGLQAHLNNPDAPAWQNEARAGGKSAAWGKQAIWGNMTPEMKAKFPGGVGTVTSRQFVSMWNDRFNGAPGAGGVPTGTPGTAYAANTPAKAASPSATPQNMQVAQATEQHKSTFGQTLQKLFKPGNAPAPAKAAPNYLANIKPIQLAQMPQGHHYAVDPASGRIITTDTQS